MAAYAIAIYRKKTNLPAAVRLLAVTVAVAVVVASPWLVRNTLLYGDPLTLKIYHDTGTNFTPQTIMSLSGWGMGDYLRNVAVRSFASFWYFLPNNLPFSRFTGNPLYLITALVIALGGVAGLYRGLKQGLWKSDERNVLLLFAVGSALLVPFFGRFVLTVFQAQGRYFLPVLLPCASLCIAGWQSLNRRAPIWICAALLGLSVLQMAQRGTLQ